MAALVGKCTGVVRGHCLTTSIGLGRQAMLIMGTLQLQQDQGMEAQFCERQAQGKREGEGCWVRNQERLTAVVVVEEG